MKRFGDETGASLIEFIIVLIPLLVLLFASIEFGVAGYNKAMITNASREGARAGIVYDTSYEPTYRKPAGTVIPIVNDYCGENLITFGAAATPFVDPQAFVNAAGDHYLRVSVTYDYGFLVLQNLIPGFAPSLNLGAESIMRYEYQN